MVVRSTKRNGRIQAPSPRLVRMPSLSEVACRLGLLPPPEGVEAEEYAFLRAIWGIYPGYTAAWTQVIPKQVFQRDVSSRLRTGRPVLEAKDIRFDAPPVEWLRNRLVKLLTQVTLPAKQGENDPISSLLSQGSDAGPSARTFFTSPPNDLRPQVMVGAFLLRPFLYMAARKASHLIQHVDFCDGTCPVCGGAPFHGMIDSLTRRKVLCCGKCHFLWTVARVRCPYCGNTEPDSQGYYFQEARPKYRIDYCLACRKILPITLQEEADKSPLLLYDHLATMDLRSSVERRAQ